jgi:hypothetical protein
VDDLIRKAEEAEEQLEVDRDHVGRDDAYTRVGARTSHKHRGNRLVGEENRRKRVYEDASAHRFRTPACSHMALEVHNYSHRVPRIARTPHCTPRSLLRVPRSYRVFTARTVMCTAF